MEQPFPFLLPEWVGLFWMWNELCVAPRGGEGRKEGRENRKGKGKGKEGQGVDGMYFKLRVSFPLLLLLPRTGDQIRARSYHVYICVYNICIISYVDLSFSFLVPWWPHLS